MKEKKVADLSGKFIHPIIRGDVKLNDATWTPGRIILSNKNIWLATGEGKKKIPLKSLTSLGGRFDVSQAAVTTAKYLSLVYSADGERRVSLITTGNEEQLDEFRNSIFNVLLNRKIVFVKHPVMKGGVMQDSEWEKGQLVLGTDGVRIGTEDGELITMKMKGVQNIEMKEANFREETRKVVSIEHVDDDDVTLDTYVYAPKAMMSALAKYVAQDFEKEVKSKIELDETEKQVIMALYSGVSPFDIPGFIGADIDRVEEIYEQLIEMNVLSEVRKRREVSLTTRGRNLASKAMGEE